MKRLFAFILLCAAASFAAVPAEAIGKSMGGGPKDKRQPAADDEIIYTVGRIRYNDGVRSVKDYYKIFRINKKRKTFTFENGTVNSGIYQRTLQIDKTEQKGDTLIYYLDRSADDPDVYEATVRFFPDGDGAQVLSFLHREPNPKEYVIGTKEQFLAPYKIIDGVEYLDLGMRVLWATKNLGAATPADVGDYYTYGYLTPAKPYPSENPYLVPSELGVTSIAGNPEYDAVTYTLGEKTRMANRLDWKQLSEDTYRDVYEDGLTYLGVKYPPFTIRIMSKKNGHSIFVVPGGQYSATEHYTKEWAYFCNGSAKSGMTLVNGGISNHGIFPELARNLRPVYVYDPTYASQKSSSKKQSASVPQAVNKINKTAKKLKGLFKKR